LSVASPMAIGRCPPSSPACAATASSHRSSSTDR
jgi:hypothetical protein